MAPKYLCRNSKLDSVRANPKAARLLTTLFTKSTVKKGDKARKWHQHPINAAKFSIIALEKFRKRFVQQHLVMIGNQNELK